jgi:hypothetical protein
VNILAGLEAARLSEATAAVVPLLARRDAIGRRANGVDTVARTACVGASEQAQDLGAQDADRAGRLEVRVRHLASTTQIQLGRDVQKPAPPLQ